MARKRVPISTARKELFHLADLVRKSGDDTVIVLDQRGGVEAVAMVREARLAYLEARVNELDKEGPVPFRLAGSLSADADGAALERTLSELRREWTPAPTVTARAPRAPRRGR